VLAVVAAGSTLLAACESKPREPTAITVYATSTMIHSMTVIGKKFEEDNPGTSVEFIFAGSTDLASELAAGAGADVFVSGAVEQMTSVVDAGLIQGAPEPFATSRLVIVTPPGNPLHLASFADLAAPGVRVSLCAAQMTCATLTRTIEGKTGVRLQPVSEEVTSEDVVRNVVTGKADAGVVFASEAITAGAHVSWVDFPEAAAAESVCEIGLLKSTDETELSKKFIREVTDETSRPVLAEAGFGEPPGQK
jgi:molybdate transport system substrate-binding protein